MSPDELDPTLEELAAASPVLADALAATKDWWDPDPMPPTIVMGDLGTAMVAAAEKAGDDELARVAAALETALGQGSEGVKDAVATGFIEAAMNAVAANPGGVRFLRKLGPLAREYARAWDRFGGVKTPGISDDPV